MTIKNTNHKPFENLSRAQFWDIIIEARRSNFIAENTALDETIMKVLEERCSNSALAQFHLFVEALREELPRLTFGVAMEILPYKDIVGAPYHQFRNWIIVQGQDIFEKVMLDPSYLKHIASPQLIKKEGLPLFQELDYVASAVHYDREEKDPSIESWGKMLKTQRKRLNLERMRSVNSRKTDHEH